MSDSNRIRASIVQESSFFAGTPASPSMLVMETTGQTMRDQIGYQQSQTIRNDANIKDLIRLQKSAGGGLPCELTFPVSNEALLTQILAVMRATVSSNDVATFTLNATVTSGESTVKRTSGSWAVDKFQAGDVIKCASASQPTITRYAKVVSIGPAASGSTFTTTNASDVINLTPPLANGTAFTVTSAGTLPGGLAAGTTYYAISSNSGANTFQASLTVGGSAVSITDDGSGTHTLTLSSALMTLEIEDDATWPASATDVLVTRGDRITNGTDSRSFTIEIARLDIEKAQVFEKQVADGFDLQVADGAITTMNFTYQGSTSTRVDAPISGSQYITGSTYTNPTAGPILDSIGVPHFVLGGNSYAVKSFSLSVTNNVQARTQVGSLGASGMRYGAFTVTGRVQAYMSTFEEMDAFAENTPSDFWFVLRDSNSAALAFSIPQFKWSDVSAPTRGLNQDDYMEGTFQAYLDPSEQCTMRLFRYILG